LRYLLRRPRQRLAEGFMRTHYLVSIGGVSFGMLVILLLLPLLLPQATLFSAWLPLTIVPYYFLYGRDLNRAGYRASDLFRIYGLNLLLVPVNIGGVLKSLQQAYTGAKIPFGRTPKVANRTAAPAAYILAECLFCLGLLYITVVGLLMGYLAAAIFTFGNFLLLAYSLVRFVGVRACWDDLLRPLRQRRARRRSVVAAPTAEQLSPTAVWPRRRWRVTRSAPRADSAVTVPRLPAFSLDTVAAAESRGVRASRERMDGDAVPRLDTHSLSTPPGSGEPVALAAASAHRSQVA
jgi:hypothetical protein